MAKGYGEPAVSTRRGKPVYAAAGVDLPSQNGGAVVGERGVAAQLGRKDFSRAERARGSATEVLVATSAFFLAVGGVATLAELLNAPKLVTIVLSPFATLLGVLLYGWIARRFASPHLEARRIAPVQDLSEAIGTALLGWLAAIGGSVVIAQLYEWVMGQGVQEQARILELFEKGNGWELSALAVAVVIVAPLAEEIFFRHLLFRRLSGWLRLDSAFLISGLLFALIHGNASGFATYLWLAACFSWAYYRSGRIGCAIFVHAANNAATFLLLVRPTLLEALHP